MNAGVVGLGKLGLPLLALLANSGHKVIGFDQSKDLLDRLTRGESPYPEPGLADLLKSGSRNITYGKTIAEVVEISEVIFVIVPTPSNENGWFDNSAVITVCREIGLALKVRPKTLTVDIVSTVMPGSCDGEIRESLEGTSNIELGDVLGLCYNPEFIALGSVIRDMQYPDMQLLGSNSDYHAAKVEEILKSITRQVAPIRRMNLKEAELVKISVNNFVTMKIAFANMLSQVADKLKLVDIDTVTDAIGLDSRVGKKYLRAGTPFGGPCFPRDTRALAALTRDLGMEDSLSLAVEESNDAFHQHLLNTILSDSKGKRIGILGLSYKSATKVVEESPGLNLLNDLAARGNKVTGWDPLITSADLVEAKGRVVDSFEEFATNVDVVFVTRPIPEVNKELIAYLAKNYQVVDFWRQVETN